MATVKPKFRPSTVDGKEGTLFYRIIHNRRSHRIRTGYKLFPLGVGRTLGRHSHPAGLR